MVSTFTTAKRIEQPANNDYVNSWDIPVNANWAIIDNALGGVATVNLTGVSGGRTLAVAEYQPLKIIATGVLTAAVNLFVPAGVGGLWVVRNNTTGAFPLTIVSSAGGAAIPITAGTNTMVTCDGSASGMVLAVNTMPTAAGLTTWIQFNDNGVLGGAAPLHWTVPSSGPLAAGGGLLTTASFKALGNMELGGSGSSITIGGSGITAPLGLNINSNQLILSAPPDVKIGIGTAPGAHMVTVAGTIESTVGGYVYPDDTVQTTAYPATAEYVQGTTQALPTDGNFVAGPSFGIGTGGTTQIWLVTAVFYVSQTHGLDFFTGQIWDGPSGTPTVYATGIISTPSGISAVGILSARVVVTGTKTLTLRVKNGSLGGGEFNGDSWISGVRIQ